MDKPAPDILLDRFELDHEPEVIGEGRFSTLLKTYVLDDLEESLEESGGYVAKVYTAGGYTEQAAMCSHEYAVLAKLKHANVIVTAGARYTDEDAGPALMILELANGGDLARAMKPYRRRGFPAARAPALLRGVSAGLKYLHEEAHMVHCDVRMENIVLGGIMGNTPKLCDFDVAHAIGEMVSRRYASCHRIERTNDGDGGGGGGGGGAGGDVGGDVGGSDDGDGDGGEKVGGEAATAVTSSGQVIGRSRMYCTPPEFLPSKSELEFAARVPFANSGGPSEYAATPQQDVWGFGLVVFELVSGLKPWDGALPSDARYFAYKRWRRFMMTADGQMAGQKGNGMLSFFSSEVTDDAILAPWSLHGDLISSIFAMTLETKPKKRKSMAEIEAKIGSNGDDALAAELALFQASWAEWIHYHGISGKYDPDASIHVGEDPSFVEGEWLERWIRFAAEDVPAALQQCAIA